MTHTEFKRWRQEAGLTQKSAGDLFGVHMRTVRRWENGERAIPLMVFRVIALAER
jgi:transcriptional regulator with XRE-family HTH domain